MTGVGRGSGAEEEAPNIDISEDHSYGTNINI